MLLPHISLLLFGLTIVSSNPEDLHQGAERQDTVSRTNRPGTMRKSGQSHSSDPFQGYTYFMRRSDDEENFDNLLQHSPADFILRPLQMLDFSRNIVSFMAKSEDEHENLGKGIIEKIISIGDTMENKIKDKFEQHDRYRRGARGESSSPYPINYQYGHPVIYDGTPEYIAPPQNSYQYHHCYVLAPNIPEHGYSSKRDHRSTDHNRNGHGNGIVICEIPEHSQVQPTYVLDQPEDIYDIHNTNVGVSVTENGQNTNGKNGY